jgi:hypothetical protein
VSDGFLQEMLRHRCRIAFIAAHTGRAMAHWCDHSRPQTADLKLRGKVLLGLFGPSLPPELDLAVSIVCET